MTTPLFDAQQWTSVVVAGFPALAAIGAAVIAGSAARKAQRSDAQAARTRALEGRISERKFEMYRPMINTLRDLLDPNRAAEMNSSQLSAQIADFSIWIGIFGSDEAVGAFHNFMQASFHQAPAVVAIRLFADFVLAARRDMGYPDTAITPTEILGIRITDLYSDRQFLDVGRKSFTQLCQEANWSPPWLATTGSAIRHEGRGGEGS